MIDLYLSDAAVTSLGDIHFVPNDLPKNQVDITAQYLNLYTVPGGVNDFQQMFPSKQSLFGKWINESDSMERDMFVGKNNVGTFVSKSIIVTSELLWVLLGQLSRNGVTKTLIEHLYEQKYNLSTIQIQELFIRGMPLNWGEDSAHEDWSPCNMTLKLTAGIINILKEVTRQTNGNQPVSLDVSQIHTTMAENGIYTWPMDLSTLSNFQHPLNNTSRYGELTKESAGKDLIEKASGHLSLDFVRYLANCLKDETSHEIYWNFQSQEYFAPSELRIENYNFDNESNCQIHVQGLIEGLYHRLFTSNCERLWNTSVLNPRQKLRSTPNSLGVVFHFTQQNVENKKKDRVSMPFQIGPNLSGVIIDDSQYDNAMFQPPKGATPDFSRLEDVEIVIVRPNIEHYMLGIIMGLGGSELGNTLWGQTELSVYDDSMHGIWGM
jgi:hypothetical protein